MKGNYLKFFTKKHYAKLAFLLGLCVSVFFFAYVLSHELRQGKLTISFLDVGQGDSIYIESPVGNHALIDAGPGSIVLRRLGNELPFYDRRIDFVMETHPDLDHSGGMPSVLSRDDVGALMVSPGNSLNKQEQLVERIAKTEEIPVVIAKRGQVVDLGGGATLRILFPDRYIEGGDTNDKSIVSELIYGKTRVLMTADEPQAVENYLASLDGDNLKADILKLGHHGSKTATGEALLGYVKPSFAIISVGKDNKYGHPNKETLDKLAKFGVPYLRTDEQGTITFVSDGNTIAQKK
ncbi:MAG: MBL fold metallo-hydrolase [Candidatus Paceibacterota bacterium]|jgi:competence protein ComEC